MSFAGLRGSFWKKKGGGGFIGCSGAFNPSITGVLDLFPGSNLAWSIRRLRDAYTGPCLRAGHVGDPETQSDICFNNNIIDVDQLIAFSEESSTGQGTFIVYAYRQDEDGGVIDFGGLGVSGQPLLTDSSNNPYLEDGLPSLNFGIGGTGKGGAGDVADFPDAPLGSTIFFVSRLKAIAASVHYLTWDVVAAPGGLFVGGSSGSVTGRGYTAANVIKMQGGGEPLMRQLTTYLGGTEKKIYANGALIAEAVDKAYSDHYIETIGRPTFSANSYVQELISYPTAITSDRASVESNINSYFSIY